LQSELQSGSLFNEKQPDMINITEQDKAFMREAIRLADESVERLGALFRACSRF